jgi:hypothetical protein
MKSPFLELSLKLEEAKIFLGSFLAYLIDNLKQPTTQNSLIAVLALSGWQIAPEKLSAIVMLAGIAFAGVNFATNETKRIQEIAEEMANRKISDLVKSQSQEVPVEPQENQNPASNS